MITTIPAFSEVELSEIMVALQGDAPLCERYRQDVPLLVAEVRRCWIELGELRGAVSELRQELDEDQS